MGQEPEEAVQSSWVEAQDSESLAPEGATDMFGAESDDVPVTTHPDLTRYQWFTTGADSAARQYLNVSNPGVASPTGTTLE